MVRSLLWICVAIAALTACARRPAAEQPNPDEGWTLTIINHHWLDVSVYVNTDGGRTHVALVPATFTQSFDMPARMITGGRLITLEANPIGANRTVRTERLLVQAGQRVEWTLESGLDRSTASVW